MFSGNTNIPARKLNPLQAAADRDLASDKHNGATKLG